MDKTWMVKSWNSDEYKVGVEQFLQFAFCNASHDGKILCPCRCCVNRYLQTKEETRVHLRCDGFLPGYTKWICHGESSNNASTSSTFPESTSSRGLEYVQAQPNLRKPDDIVGLLRDAIGVVRQVNDNIALDVDEEVDSENVGIDIEQPGVSTTGVSSEFQKLLDDVDKEVYPGCKTFSKLSCILHIYHMKYLNGWTEKSVSMLLEFLLDLLPEGALLPKTYYESKKIITTLGLDYKKIDACENDCMLFWGEKSSDEVCSKCGTSRWVVNKNEQVNSNDNSVNKPVAKRKKPVKVLRYFPLIPRLQRLFISKKTSTDMRWHAVGRIKDGMLRHPADGEAWRAFDAQFPNFSSDPRNVRFGLSSDGFNPFRTMSTNYSTWPVMLIPYNMSPWICMKQSSFILSMIIPGKKGPGNDIDVYLQPLIEELKLLWEGVETYDAFGGETFNLRGALMWTINDFPAYAYLSGWSTKGRFACPCCAEFTNSRWLYKGGKHCYMGHRRWLPHDHSFRFKEHLFDGTQELGMAPVRATSGDVLNQLDDLQFGLEQLGKQSKSKKGKRKKQTVNIDEANPEMEIDVDDLKKAAMKHWKKKSIFFVLPYWEHNLLRHNLDVMHIEKNVCDNLIGTLLNLEYKSKDNEKARLDLVDMGIREELHPIEDANGKRRLPLACFSLTSTEKDIFCQVLKNMKLPDGYSSNISRCVNLKDRKISGLKSHDCHILIEDLLPLALKSCSPSKQLTSIVIELAAFFKSICSKSIDPKELDKIQERVVLTLCHMEMTFLPGFFTIMVHLMVHLVEEVKLGGPVQYRWMYPSEREFVTYKSSVRNRAHPEGSIAEWYIANECLTFCSRYLEGVETKFNRPLRNPDPPTNQYAEYLFASAGQTIGKIEDIVLDDKSLTQAHRYVLRHCDQLVQYRQEFIDIEKRKRRRQTRLNPNDLEVLINENFHVWLQSKVIDLARDSNISAEILALGRGPNKVARRFSGFIINGSRFHTKTREEQRLTQNSGVVNRSEGGGVEYFGKLRDIIELNYYGSFKVVLFKCDWIDVHHSAGMKKDEYGYTLVNFSRLIHTGDNVADDPYIFSSQADQVFYVEDPSNLNWHVVIKIKPRDAFDMGHEEGDDHSVSRQILYEQMQPDWVRVDVNNDDL